MSLAVRIKRVSPAASSSVANEAAHATATSTYRAEAPDSGEREREAPESRRPHSSEGPDAGDGRASCLEQEFTHGRSQS